MIRRYWFIIAIALMPLGPVPAAWAADKATPPPESMAVEFVDELSSQAIAALRDESVSKAEREDIFADLLEEGFALEFIGRFVLGRYSHTATAEERSDYDQLFSTYVLKTYTGRLGPYADQEFNVKGAQPAGSRDVYVKSEVTQVDGPPIAIDRRVRRFDNGLKIIDVIIEGVSMALTQRQEFASVVQRNGMEGLLEMLRARINKAS